MWEEEDEAAVFIAQRRNGHKGTGKSTFERGYNSLIRTAHCPLQKVSYAPHDPQSTRHRLQVNRRPQPKALPVGGHVDLEASGFLNRGIQARMGRKGMCRRRFGSDRGGNLCNNCPSGFSECADVHRPSGIF